MRWLLQQGTRWLGSQLWSQARQKGRPATSPQRTKPVTAPTTMAVVCESKRLYDAVADRLSRPQVFEGDRFSITLGLLAGQPVVVARALAPVPQLVPLLRALVDAHQPRFVLSAAEGASLRDDLRPGHVVVATRVTGADGRSLRLDGSAPPISGMAAGRVTSHDAPAETRSASDDPPPLAADHWTEPMARACLEVGLPLTAACVVFEPVASQRSPGVDAMKRHSSRVAQAGVLAGMLWKKRSGLRDLWNANEASWEALARLGRYAEHLAAAADD